MTSTTFMDLPKEIRSMVFAELVSIKNNVGWQRISPRGAGTWKHSTLTWKVPFELFVLNRQLSEEALISFYRENKLVSVRSHAGLFLEDASCVIPLRRVSVFEAEAPSGDSSHIALNVDLSVAKKMPETKKWQQCTGRYHCFLMSGEELPKLVRLMNVQLNMVKDDGRAFSFNQPFSIHLDFGSSSRFYRDNTKLAGELADKLKGLRQFEEWTPDITVPDLVNPGWRNVVISNLSKEMADGLLSSSNLEVLSLSQLFNEAIEIKAEGDMYAEKGDYLTARRNYFMAYFMLDSIWVSIKQIINYSLGDPSDQYREACSLRGQVGPIYVGLLLSSARASEKLKGFSSCSLCFIAPWEKRKSEHCCDYGCEARHLREDSKKKMWEISGYLENEDRVQVIAAYCKDYMEHGDLQEAASTLRCGILRETRGSKILRDLAAEVKSQLPMSKRALRRKQSKAQRLMSPFKPSAS
ncbi:hypothetical protein HYFRA_00004485 [Hymenoscyphus fraxineus]|uniref:Uncharacterized protein n=1 Tax=Hymenoscyphus fraxineus TaxID=746836 RepID=A0A9N9KXU5_9HELO|nr:hypothetical protein HYFRA_00004485 [Hymenoscyphus fraxineus]